jgi:hypothetical protein
MKSMTVMSWNWSEKQGSVKKRNRGFWFWSKNEATCKFVGLTFSTCIQSASLHFRTISTIDIVDEFSTLFIAPLLPRLFGPLL